MSLLFAHVFHMPMGSMHRNSLLYSLYLLYVCLASAVDLPATDGSAIECEANPSHMPSGKLTHFSPQMPTSAVAGLSGDKADNFVVWVVSLVRSVFS